MRRVLLELYDHGAIRFIEEIYNILKRYFLTLLKIRTLDFLLVGLCLTYKYPLSLGAAGL